MNSLAERALPCIDDPDAAFGRYVTRYHAGQWLFHNLYPVYDPLYTLYKRYGDRFFINRIRKHVRPGDTVLDIGANVGFYTAILAKQVGPAGTVHAFEPDPSNFRRLTRRVGQLQNVVLHQSAIAERAGSLSLYVSQDLNVDHRVYDDGSGRSSVSVRAVSVDEMLEGSPVHFIKMDIQGAELPALRGMRKTLSKIEKPALSLEMWPYGLRKAGASATKMLAQLAELGYDAQPFEEASGDLGRPLDLAIDWDAEEQHPEFEHKIWCEARTP